MVVKSVKPLISRAYRLEGAFLLFLLQAFFITFLQKKVIKNCRGDFDSLLVLLTKFGPRSGNPPGPRTCRTKTKPLLSLLKLLSAK